MQRFDATLVGWRDVYQAADVLKDPAARHAVEGATLREAGSISPMRGQRDRHPAPDSPQRAEAGGINGVRVDDVRQEALCSKPYGLGQAVDIVLPPELLDANHFHSLDSHRLAVGVRRQYAGLFVLGDHPDVVPRLLERDSKVVAVAAPTGNARRERSADK